MASMWQIPGCGLEVGNLDVGKTFKERIMATT
jgi:hypothetical protein